MDELTLAEKKEFAETMVALGRAGMNIIPIRTAARHSTPAVIPTRRTVYRENTTDVPPPPNMNDYIKASAKDTPPTTLSGPVPAPSNDVMNSFIRSKIGRK